MKNLRLFGAANFLTLILSVSAFAGDILTPGVTGEVTTPGVTGDILIPGVAGQMSFPVTFILSVLQSALS